MIIGYKIKKDGKWIDYNGQLTDNVKTAIILFEKELNNYDYDEIIPCIDNRKRYKLRFCENDLWFSDRNPYRTEMGRSIYVLEDEHLAKSFIGQISTIRYCKRYHLYEIEVK